MAAEPVSSVTIEGREYPALADGIYDVIILGTGLKECIVAGLLAVHGMKVLIVDRNKYYGGDSASLNLTHLYEKFRGTEPSEAIRARFGPNRDWNVDLIPKFIMARGQLVKILLHTGVSNYLEFKCVDGSYVYKGEKHAIYKVPATEMEAVRTPLMGFFQKRYFQKFLKFVAESYDPEFTPEGPRAPELETTPMREVYRKYGLDENSQDFTGHAMALHSSDRYMDEPASRTVRAVKLYAYSLAMYERSPYIYPMYGLGGLPEGFSRLCAIKGGTFMLDTVVDEIITNADGVAVGVRSGDKAASTKLIVGAPSYFAPEKVRGTYRVVRSIFIMDHPIAGTEGQSAQVIIPFSQVSKGGFRPRTHDIYITCVSHAHAVAGKGLYIAIASTQVETADPVAELEPAVRLLQPFIERFDSVSDCVEPVADGTADKMFITKSYDASSHFETTTADVMDVFQRIMGHALDMSAPVAGAGSGSGSA